MRRLSEAMPLRMGIFAKTSRPADFSAPATGFMREIIIRTKKLRHAEEEGVGGNGGRLKRGVFVEDFSNQGVEGKAQSRDQYDDDA